MIAEKLRLLSIFETLPHMIQASSLYMHSFHDDNDDDATGWERVPSVSTQQLTGGELTVDTPSCALETGEEGSLEASVTDHMELEQEQGLVHSQAMNSSSSLENLLAGPLCVYLYMHIKIAHLKCHT